MSVTRSATVAFELDRFELEAGSLAVEGRWFGVRGRRFVRPSLSRAGAGGSDRVLAGLEHKPWPAEDGEPWEAAFPWPGQVPKGIEFELVVAPDICIRLPAPAAERAAASSCLRRSGPSEPAGGGAQPSAPSETPVLSVLTRAGQSAEQATSAPSATRRCCGCGRRRPGMPSSPASGSGPWRTAIAPCPSATRPGTASTKRARSGTTRGRRARLSPRSCAQPAASARRRWPRATSSRPRSPARPKRATARSSSEIGRSPSGTPRFGELRAALAEAERHRAAVASPVVAPPRATVPNAPVSATAPRPPIVHEPAPPRGRPGSSRWRRSPSSFSCC